MKVQIICFLLVVFAATYLCLDNSPGSRYDKFKNQHIKQDMDASECDNVMEERQINGGTRKECKKTNTFILDTEEKVVSVCEKDGKPYNNKKDMTLSNKQFDIVVCKLKERKGKKQKGKSKCHYGGEKLKKRMIIKCTGYPVHYDGDIAYID